MAEGTTLVDLLDRAAAEHPDRTAWTFDLPDGREQLTFADVADRSQRLAGALAARGVRHGDRVGVMLGNTAQMPLTWLALMRLGAAMVPLLTLGIPGDAIMALRVALMDAHAAPPAGQ